MTFVVPRERAQWVHDMARARAGLPYAYGGAFTTDPRRSTDCSGLVLQTGAWYAGRTDWSGNRYGSTESFRLDHKIVYDIGFRRMPPGGPAALPFKPVMLVGLQHGGGGVYSHTACTLMTMDIPGGPVKMSARGVDWESRGGNPGVFLYDGARAWNDPLFHDFWYLDAVLEGGAPQVDAADVLARATGLSYERAREILPTMQEGLRLADCTNPNRIAMALAQWGHESDDFRATEEYADGPEDEERWKYKGRTWIQITWRGNYERFSRWCFDRGLVPTPTYFADSPRALADIRWAGIGAAWYWTVERPSINRLCDERNITEVTRLINGAATWEYPSWLKHRQERYDRAIALGDELMAIINGGDDLTPEQDKMLREVHACLFNKTESWSPLATPGEGARWMLHEKIHSIDGMLHPIHAKMRAKAGDLGELHRIVLAASGKGKLTDPVTVRVFQNVLVEIEKENPEVLQQYNALRGAA
ncbi:lysin A [Mycobacterium phage Sheen]|uniref:Lysin A n=1 Tax=Mycobacterium phage Sheen TaxID=1589274 RepID=A0A0B5A0U2_9CAUD|nr:endolysin [Mycobacterium phage Sheen]AJD82428.1 lysin A [Mycobacterium phage Sheen]